MLPCNGCTYKGQRAGTRHIRCHFRWMPEPIEKLRGAMNEEEQSRVLQLSAICSTVPTRAAQWFRFPINYDPVWGPDTCPRRSGERNDGDYIESYPPMVELMGMF